MKLKRKNRQIIFLALLTMVMLVCTAAISFISTQSDAFANERQDIGERSSPLYGTHGEMRILHQARYTTNRITIKMIADRYTYYQQDEFFASARSMANYIVSAYPLNNFAPWIQIYGIGVSWFCQRGSQNLFVSVDGGFRHVRPFVQHHFPNITSPSIANNHSWLIIDRLLPRHDAIAISPEAEFMNPGSAGLAFTGPYNVVGLHELAHLWGLIDEYDSASRYPHYINRSNLRSNVNLADPTGGILDERWHHYGGVWNRPPGDPKSCAHERRNMNTAIPPEWAALIGNEPGPNNTWEGPSGIGIFPVTTFGWHDVYAPCGGVGVTWFRPSQNCIMNQSHEGSAFCLVCVDHLTRRFSEGRTAADLYEGLIFERIGTSNNARVRMRQGHDFNGSHLNIPAAVLLRTSPATAIIGQYVLLNVTTITPSAFANFMGHTVSIPHSITQIYPSAFRNAVNLRSVRSYSFEPAQINDSVFFGVHRPDVTLYIPDAQSSLWGYRDAGWFVICPITRLPCETGFNVVERVHALLVFDIICRINNEVSVRAGPGAWGWRFAWLSPFGIDYGGRGIETHMSSISQIVIPSFTYIDGVRYRVTRIVSNGFRLGGPPIRVISVPCSIVHIGYRAFSEGSHILNWCYCLYEYCPHCGDEWEDYGLCSCWCFMCGDLIWVCTCPDFEFDGYDVVLRAEDFGISDECLSLHGVLMLNTDDGNALIFHWVRGEVRDGYLYVFINAGCFFSGAGGSGASIDMIGGFIGFSFDAGGDVFYGVGVLELIARECDGCCDWVFEECCEYWEYGCVCWDWWVPCCDYWWECDCLQCCENWEEGCGCWQCCEDWMYCYCWLICCCCLGWWDACGCEQCLC